MRKGVQVVQAVQANPYLARTRSLFREWKERKEKQEHNKETPGPPGPLDPIRETDAACSAERIEAATVCRYCGRPIDWGQITEIFGQCDYKVGQWVPLDPDEMQHECRCRVKAAATEEDSA